METGRGGLPVAVYLPRRRRVTAIRDQWRVEDEWWRAQPLCRHYVQVLLENGHCLTLFYDLLSRDWYRQNY